ncbi:MAG: outer membrane protein assembly factor BamD, partial [Holosporales bacterium]
MAQQNMAWRILGLVCALGMSGCSDKEDPYKERPAEELYQEGMQSLKDKKFEKAAKAFDEVERQHPYSKWAPKAQLMAGYAYYEGQQYEKAIAAMESFVQLHPAHQDVPYALYMQGMCYYEQISPVERDQKITEMALSVFEDLVRRFPEASYSKDARFKIDLLRDNLAGKEMDVGRYYQKRGSYLSAMNRFRVVVEKFQTTQHVGEALYRLVEVYLALGMRAEAQATAA